MRSALTFFLRLGLGAVLLYAGIEKVRHPFDFLSAVYGYQLVDAKWGLFIAGAMPWLEIVGGAALIWGLWLPGASAAALLLCLVVCVATGSAYVRGLQITCGCFGGAGHTIDAWVVLRSLLLLGAGVLTFVLVRTGREKESNEVLFVATEAA